MEREGGAFRGTTYKRGASITTGRGGMLLPPELRWGIDTADGGGGTFVWIRTRKLITIMIYKKQRRC